MKAQNTIAGVGSTFDSKDDSFNAVKVFSATMIAERGRLGEKVTDWIRGNPSVDVRGAFVTQSSDDQFHCIAITLFYWQDVD